MSPKRPFSVISLSAGNLACIVYSRAIKLLIVSSRKVVRPPQMMYGPASDARNMRARGGRAPPQRVFLREPSASTRQSPAGTQGSRGPSRDSEVRPCQLAEMHTGRGGRRGRPIVPHLVPRTSCLSPSTFLLQVCGSLPRTEMF